jgi:hypothetical protein
MTPEERVLRALDDLRDAMGAVLAQRHEPTDPPALLTLTAAVHLRPVERHREHGKPARIARRVAQDPGRRDRLSAPVRPLCVRGSRRDRAQGQRSAPRVSPDRPASVTGSQQHCRRGSVACKPPSVTPTSRRRARNTSGPQPTRGTIAGPPRPSGSPGLAVPRQQRADYPPGPGQVKDPARTCIVAGCGQVASPALRWRGRLEPEPRGPTSKQSRVAGRGQGHHRRRRVRRHFALARALVAGVVADALGMPAAIGAVALLTAASGVVVLLRMRETLVRAQ